MTPPTEGGDTYTPSEAAVAEVAKNVADQLRRLQLKVCTCGHGSLPPAFHAHGPCPVAGIDMP